MHRFLKLFFNTREGPDASPWFCGVPYLSTCRKMLLHDEHQFDHTHLMDIDYTFHFVWPYERPEIRMTLPRSHLLISIVAFDSIIRPLKIAGREKDQVLDQTNKPKATIWLFLLYSLEQFVNDIIFYRSF